MWRLVAGFELVGCTASYCLVLACPRGAPGPILLEFVQAAAKFVTILGCYNDETGVWRQALPKETWHAARRRWFRLVCDLLRAV